jgi:hypothetical protein
MTVFRTLAAAVQVVLVVLFAWVLLMGVLVAFMLLALLATEETMTRAMSYFIVTFLALVLIALVVVTAKGLWRGLMSRSSPISMA